MTNLKYLKILLLVSLSLIVFPLPIFAQEKIESTNYTVQFPDSNSGIGIPISSDFSLDTLDQTTQGDFYSDGYTVRSGFQYSQEIIPFTFEISDILVNFNTLAASTPATKEVTLKVKTGGAAGYSVKAIESNSLKKSLGLQTIPDTQCDSGQCNETRAYLWTSSSTYGFGYNMQGDDVPSTFASPYYFRPFPNGSASENPVTIMSKDKVTWKHPNEAWPWESKAVITYKINISGTQPAGVYQNVISFIALPSF